MAEINTTTSSTTTADTKADWQNKGEAKPPLKIEYDKPGKAMAPESPDKRVMVALDLANLRQGGKGHWVPQLRFRFRDPVFTIEEQSAEAGGVDAPLPIRGYLEVGAASNIGFSSLHAALPVSILDPEFLHVSAVPRLKINKDDKGWHPGAELSLRFGFKAYKDLSVSVEYGMAWWNVGNSDAKKDYFWNADSVLDGFGDFFKPNAFAIGAEWFF
ncbi:hypothetical protein BVY03_04790 [bacterium K02(2017)]|nr:hypothetical protein BVY03_04790 [bacterium K02(2017)]